MSDLEITDVETYVVDTERKPWVFVRLLTDQGIHGIGEAPICVHQRNTVPLVEELGQSLIGKDPFDTHDLFTNRGLTGASHHNILASTIIGAFDVACWDIKGKHHDVPIHELLGGSIHGDSIRAYANGWYTDIGRVTEEYRTSEQIPEQFAEDATRVVDEGYGALKFDPFSFTDNQPSRAELNHALNVVRAVREAVGPDIDILIEGHKLFTTDRAVQVSKRLEEFDPGFFEEPTPPERAALETVAAKSSVPIATGESIPDHRAYADLLATTDVSIVQPDSLRVGGITELARVATLASAHNVSFAPHNAHGPISTAVAVHVAATAPTFSIQETFEDFAHPEWRDELVENPIEIVDGRIPIPDRPGLGIDLDVAVMREREYVRCVDQ